MRGLMIDVMWGIVSIIAITLVFTVVFIPSILWIAGVIPYYVAIPLQIVSSGAAKGISDNL